MNQHRTAGRQILTFLVSRTDAQAFTSQVSCDQLIIKANKSKNGDKYYQTVTPTRHTCCSGRQCVGVKHSYRGSSVLVPVFSNLLKNLTCCLVTFI